MLLLIASLAALALGPLLYRMAGSSRLRRARTVAEILVLVAVGSLVVLHIMPECVHQAGWIAMVPLVLGLLGPTLTERWLRSFVHGAHLLVRIIVVTGLAVHAFVDGLGLAVPTADDEALHALPLAIALHRVPVGMVIWWLIRPAYGIKLAASALGMIAVSTVVGYATGGALVEYAHGPALALFQAWVAGSLLHIAVHPLDPSGHAHDPA